ncbi:MAG: aldehyde dehydrogenase [Elusimicrobia bacterium RIFCSPHIGHO2_02_FULL_57_9]|nr:MAG: aldehyde dehydrogenase [Elusimicrobia bacterium RIFCSPHIGHO2_02_FULL_57_9]
MKTLTKTEKAPANLKQYIAGKWIEGGSERQVVSTNPADARQVLAQFRCADKNDALSALAAASQAALAWRNTTPPARGRILAKAAQIARERAPELAALMTREEGKILAEAKGEMDKGITLMEWFAGEGLRFMGITAPSELPKNLLYTVRQPLGVVSIITPWNFPWAIPVWKISPALVAGNAVVFKPASLVPAMAVEIVKIFEQAGLPPGVLNLVLGAGSALGDTLVEDPRIRAVSFTGSNSIGQRVHGICGKRGAKVTCEMGGKNPAIVWDDADLELALGGVVKGAFGATGQRCTATSRLIIHEKVADEFQSMLLSEMKKIKVGDGMNPAVGMGPAVDAAQLKTDLDYIEIAKTQGAKLVYGGRHLQEGDLKHGYFVEPTLFEGVTPSMRIFKEEVFGPVLSVTRVKTFAQAMEAANAVEFGLTSAIYTQDLTLAMRFADEMEAGMVHVNSPTVGGEAQVPFGGVKRSGVGEREMSKEGLHFFTELKTVFIDYTGKRRESNLY